MDTVERYVQSFLSGLVDGGVKNAVVCPGSRSTPIALALSRRKDIRVWMLYDERSAGFFALGMARSSSAPVVLLSTSGTATANFLPAVAEANLSRVPLVAVTADRPPESRDFGAAQTIDQIRLYGSRVKWFQDMPMAEDMQSLFRYSRIVGARASHAARDTPAGPVHINFSFRDPLMSAGQGGAGEQGPQGRVSLTKSRIIPDAEDVEVAFGRIEDGSRGIIVAGARDIRKHGAAVSNLAKALGWPVLADPLSNLRQGDSQFGLVRCYELLLRDEKFRRSHVPDWIVRLGAIPTSRDLNSFCDGPPTVLLGDGGEWHDPEFRASAMIQGDLGASLEMASKAMNGFRSPRGWLRSWLDADLAALQRADELMEGTEEPFEGKVFHRLSRLLRPASPLTVVVGNSMPVRDLDAFFLRGDPNVRLFGNRGANGIDGLVSTAMGVAAAEGDVLLVLGDMSFYHDMNGLLASKLHGLNATVVVVNNNGGGIFSFLAQRSLPRDVFEKLFGTPHGLDFSGVKTIYGGEFRRVADWPAFDEALRGSLEKRGLKVIEFMAADRETNFVLHERVFKQAADRGDS